MKNFIIAFLLSFGIAFGQVSTSQPLSVHKTNGTITAPVPAATFLSANSIAPVGDVNSSGAVIKINGITLSGLATGLYKNTTGTGAVSIALEGTDYWKPGGTDVAVADGGTGLSVYAIGDILIATGTTTLAKLPDIAVGNVLISGGVGVAPSYGKVTTAHTTGIAASGANADLTSITGLTSASSITEAALGGNLPTLANNAGVGLVLINTTAAANNAQQVAPTVQFRGFGWSTGAGASQSLQYEIGMQPIQGSSTVTGGLNFRSSAAGGAFTTAVRMDVANTPSTSTTAGALVVTGGIAANQKSNLSELQVNGPAGTTGFTIAQTARTSGILPYFAWTIPADTGQTASTESIGFKGTTGTRTWATTGTVALQREVYFPGPTYASAGASQTFTEACTVYIDKPNAGTNAIFTRGHSLAIVDATTATSSTAGAVVIANALGTGATSVAIGGGAIWTGSYIVSGGAIQVGTKINNYNGVATAGWGVPAIQGANRVTAQTGASASVTTYTVGAADGTFTVSGNVLVTTSTTHTFTMTCAYTDEGNTARVLTLPFSLLAGTTTTSITNTNGAVPYMGLKVMIRCKAATAITFATTGTFTTVTYNAEGNIQQVN